MQTTTLPMTYKLNQCAINAFVNQKNHYKALGLKLVIGSLAINGWFEFGGKTWTKDDFLAKAHGITADCHYWLEDKEGNVYDFLFTDYNDWVKIRTRKPMKRTGLLEGVSKEALLADAIEYVPAPKDAQLALFSRVRSYLVDVHRDLHSGEASWVGDYLQMSAASAADGGRDISSLMRMLMSSVRA